MFINYTPAADLLSAARDFRANQTEEIAKKLDRAIEAAAKAVQYSEEEINIIEIARGLTQERGGDDIEIDDNPGLSHGDEGCWVSAWIYVPSRDRNEEDDQSSLSPPIDW